jgi:hypothetical protein
MLHRHHLAHCPPSICEENSDNMNEYSITSCAEMKSSVVLQLVDLSIAGSITLITEHHNVAQEQRSTEYETHSTTVIHYQKHAK